MSVERRLLLAAYGAELVLTPRGEGMKGAVAKAAHIASTTKNAFMPMQFQNQANPDHHYKVTAMEILADFPEGVDFLITGIGTGGHISGVGKKLKEAFPEIPPEARILTFAYDSGERYLSVKALWETTR